MNNYSLTENARKRLLPNSQKTERPLDIINSAKQSLGKTVKPFTPQIKERPMSVVPDGFGSRNKTTVILSSQIHDDVCKYLKLALNEQECYCRGKLEINNENISQLVFATKSLKAALKFKFLETISTSPWVKTAETEVGIAIITLELSRDASVKYNSLKSIHHLLKSKSFEVETPVYDCFKVLLAESFENEIYFKTFEQILSIYSLLTSPNQENWSNSIIELISRLAKLETTSIPAAELLISALNATKSFKFSWSGRVDLIERLLTTFIYHYEATVLILQQLCHDELVVQESTSSILMKFIKAKNTPNDILERVCYILANTSASNPQLECYTENVELFVRLTSNSLKSSDLVLCNSSCLLANIATLPQVAIQIFEMNEIHLLVEALEQGILDPVATQNICALIANLSYYLSFKNIIFNSRDKIAKLMINLMLSNNESITLECCRTFVNYCRCESFRYLMHEIHGTQVLLVLLEHHNREIVFNAMGALVNLTAMDSGRFKHAKVLSKHSFLSISHEILELCQEYSDYELLQLTLKALFNYYEIDHEIASSSEFREIHDFLESSEDLKSEFSLNLEYQPLLSGQESQ